MVLVVAMAGGTGNSEAWWVPASSLRLPSSSCAVWPTSRQAFVSSLPNGYCLTRVPDAMQRLPKPVRDGLLTKARSTLLAAPAESIAMAADVLAAGSATDACMWLVALAAETADMSTAVSWKHAAVRDVFRVSATAINADCWTAGVPGNTSGAMGRILAPLTLRNVLQRAPESLAECILLACGSSAGSARQVCVEDMCIVAQATGAMPEDISDDGFGL